MILSSLMYLLCTLFQMLNACDKQQCPLHLLSIRGQTALVFMC